MGGVGGCGVVVGGFLLLSIGTSVSSPVGVVYRYIYWSGGWFSDIGSSGSDSDTHDF